MKRREALALFAAAAAAPLFARAAAPKAAQPVVEVWRSLSCGCCGNWITHLQKNGFATNVHVVDDNASARRTLGIPEPLGSCHTAKVDGYALEGHVPASDIKRLLAERPKARGLVVPGMPQGSPGMDYPRSPAYDVLLLGLDGRTSVWSRQPAT